MVELGWPAAAVGLTRGLCVASSASRSLGVRHSLTDRKLNRSPGLCASVRIESFATGLMISRSHSVTEQFEKRRSPVDGGADSLYDPMARWRQAQPDLPESPPLFVSHRRSQGATDGQASSGTQRRLQRIALPMAGASRWADRVGGAAAVAESMWIDHLAAVVLARKRGECFRRMRRKGAL